MFLAFSPKSPHSPVSEPMSDIGTIQEGQVLGQIGPAKDWVYDWASRPETQPPR